MTKRLQLTAPIVVLAALPTGGCSFGDGADECPSGQERVCTGGDCRCGAPCRCNAHCTGSRICAEYRYAPGTGVCVDPGYGGVTTGLTSCSGGGAMGGPGTQCSPPCDGASVCAAVDGAPRCLRRCSTSGECSTCCSGSVGGVRVCAPALAQCMMTNPGAGGCSPACASDSSCVTVDGAPRCLRTCASDGECPACCVTTSTGVRVCAPSQDFCAGGSGGACPAGTYRLYRGGPCAPPTPSSCPNGYIVCNCPATHGLWCHPECQFPLNCGGSSNSSYPCR